MKTQFIKDMQVGERVNDVFALKSKTSVRKYLNGYMFELRIADRTGEMAVKYWGDQQESAVKSVYEGCKALNAVHVTGTVHEYRGALEISVNKVDGDYIAEADGYEIEDFIPKCKHDTALMLAELLRFKGSVDEPYLRKLLDDIFADETFLQEFKSAPASMMYHQNCLGGLLEHTLNVVKLCDGISRLYPELDHDLLITGAILHDIGKLYEMQVSTTIDISTEGMLRGHIVIGEGIVRDRIGEVEAFPETLRLKLLHLMLSNHGEKRFGAPKVPKSPEAVALHFADYTESRISMCLKIRAEAKSETLWVYDKRTGPVFLG